MADVVRLYQEVGWPLFEAAGFDRYVVGYFVSDTGLLSQLVHLWRFSDDAERRKCWQDFASDVEVQRFAAHLRPMLISQEVQLLSPAPWGPQP